MIALALLASLLWGVADFLAGRASRAHAVVLVAFVGQAAGLLALSVVLLFTGADADAVPAGIAAGLVGVAGVLTFYKALALGTMSIVAPIASTGAIVPLLVGIVDGERPHALQWLGMAIALTGVALASTENASTSKAIDARKALRLAVASAVLIGFTLAALAEASDHDALTGVTVARATSVPLLALVVLRVRARLPWRDIPQLGAIGVIDTAANASFALATTTGLLSLVAVVGGLYPVITVALAYVLLQERLQGVQRIGVLLAILGVPLISGG